VNDYWVCPSCRSLNRGRAKECYSCHAPYAPFDASAAGSAPVAGSPSGMEPAPAAPPVAALASAAPGGMFLAGADAAVASSPPQPGFAAGVDAGDGLGVLGGIVGGAIGAIVSAAVWYLVVTASHIQAGIVAIAVGWIVGQAVVLAAGRRSMALVVVSVVWTFLALVVAQYLIAIRLVNEALTEVGAGFQVPLFVSPGAFVDVLVTWLQDDPLTLVFWAIALFEAVVIPWRRLMRATATRWPGTVGKTTVNPH
jgi:hypothetical protein